MSLSGQHVFVTRPAHKAGSLSRLLDAAGARTTEFPLLFLGPPESWVPFDAAFATVDSFDWVLFASATAVAESMDRLSETGITFGKTKIAVVGTATQEALSSYGISADFCPGEFSAEGLVAEFPGVPDLSGVRVLWPRTTIGRMYIKDELTRMGAEVSIVHAYSNKEPDNWADAAASFESLLLTDPPSVITLTSSKTAENLSLILKHTRNVSLDGVVLAALGEPTAQTMRECLGRVDVTASPSTMEGLVAALESYFAR